MDKLRDLLWRDVEDVYEAILRHDFIRGMMSGSLELSVFREYVIQDYLYLSAFARAVGIVASKAPRDEWAATLLKSAAGALSIEREWLHGYLLSEWGIKKDELESHRMLPVNHAYTSFLTAMSHHGSFLEGLAAIMPCFWVYREVGLRMAETGSPSRTYQRWIETYTSEEYGEAVEEALSILDEAGAGLGNRDLHRLRSLFRLSAIYEYMFWDQIYRRIDWPLSPDIRQP